MDDNRRPLAYAFAEIASVAGDSQQVASELFDLLPSPLRDADVGNDFLNQLTRYDFGPPFTGVGGHNVFGTHQLNQVSHLYRAIRSARQPLAPDQLAEYLHRLNSPAKHNDVLLEMRPLIDLPAQSSAEYEVPGQKGKHIDWEIRVGVFRLRLDVKNRVKGALAHFADIASAWKEGMRKPPVPKTDPEAFFLSTEQKFLRNFCPLILQGVWTHVHIKEDKAVIESYFDRTVDRRRIDFLIICGWDDNGAYILTRHSWQKRLLKSVFSLSESENFVF